MLLLALLFHYSHSCSEELLSVWASNHRDLCLCLCWIVYFSFTFFSCIFFAKSSMMIGALSFVIGYMVSNSSPLLLFFNTFVCVFKHLQSLQQQFVTDFSVFASMKRIFNKCNQEKHAFTFQLLHHFCFSLTKLQ